MMAGKKSIVFLAKFFLIFGIGEMLLLFAPLKPLEQAITGFESGLLGLQAIGNTVQVGDYGFVINESCTGAVSSIILLALVFSLKKPGTKTRIAMVAIGTVALFTANLVRVYVVLWSAVAFSPEAAEIIHVVSWFGVSAMIIAVWYYLTKRSANVQSFKELL